MLDIKQIRYDPDYVESQLLRLNNEDGRRDFPYALNGSALSLPRIIIAILETFYPEGKGIKIPEVLHKYYAEHQLKKDMLGV